MIYFYLKETFRSIKKAKLAFLISLITSCISVLFISISLFLVIFSTYIENKINERAILNIFIDDSAEGELIKSELEQTKYFTSIEFISKEDAKIKFLNETGQDFSDVLEANPLPQSFEVLLKPIYVSDSNIEKIKNEMSKITGVDEVVYDSSLLLRLIRFLASIKIYLVSTSILFIIISIYLVYSTNKLIIMAKDKQINTMKLVGAKISTIKIPIILYGVFIGLLASILTTAVLLLITSSSIINNYIPFWFSLYWQIYIIVYFSGPIIGLFGSLLASMQISLKVNNKILF